MGSKLWKGSVFLFLLVLPVFSWFFIIAAPVLLPLAILVSFLAFTGFKIHMAAKLSSIEIKRLELVLRDYVSRLRLPVKVCSCVFVKDGQMQMAAQFEHGEKLWNTWAKAGDFNGALSQLESDLAKGGNALPRCSVASCALSADCPNRQQGMEFRLLRFVA